MTHLPHSAAACAESLSMHLAAFDRLLCRALPVRATGVVRLGDAAAEIVVASRTDMQDALLRAAGAPGSQPHGLAADTLVSAPYPSARGGSLVAVALSDGAADPEQAALFRDCAQLLLRAVAAEQEARESLPAHVSVRDVLEALPEALAVFDAEERFVFWNSKFAEIYGIGVELRVGRTFEAHLRDCLNQGAVLNAVGREDEWLADRLHRFRLGQGAHEHPLANGKWVRTQDRPLKNGGRIGIRLDVTELVEREQSFKLLFEANPTPMLIVDRESLEILAVNDASAAFYGYDKQALTRMSLPDIRPERADGEIRSMIERLDTSEIAEMPRIHVKSNGEQRIVEVSTRFIEHKGRRAILAAVFDITERQKAEEEVRRTRRFLRSVVDHVPLGLFVKDMQHDGRYELYNKASEELFGHSHVAVVGRNDAELFGAELARHYGEQDQDVLRRGTADVVDEEFGRRYGGRSIRLRKVALPDDATGKARYVLGLADDITDQRNREAAIERLALQDALTGLANRRRFEEQLRSSLAETAPDRILAALFIDLDGFKAVNDSLGHAAGDALLREVGDRLRATLRPTDPVARVGGDEFAVLVTVSQPGEAAWIASRIVAALAQPYSPGGATASVSASVGICLSSAGCGDAAELLERADEALYKAKAAGKNRFQFWEAPDAKAKPATEGASRTS